MKKLKILFPMTLIIMVMSCTDLDEVLFDRIDARKFYNTEEEIQAALTNAYWRLMNNENFQRAHMFQEQTTEIGITPTRTNGGWGDGGRWIQMHFHTWDATHRTISRSYNGAYSVIASTNSLIEFLEGAEGNLDPNIAEMRALRAYSYLNLLDYYGNVPIVTVAQLDLNNLPSNINTTRKDVFDFVESELTDLISDIPAIEDMTAAERKAYYPRLSREAVNAMLAWLYLNAEVYSGIPRWADCIKACDEVINSNVFSLTGNIWDSFVPENEDSPEIIFAISKSNLDLGNAGSNWINQLGLHPLSAQTFDLPSIPWGGISIGIDHYNDYDDDDFRKTMILNGDQYSSSGEYLYTITEISDIFNSPDEEGLKSIKYQPDPQKVGLASRNDYVMLRYAEVLMTKAEAEYRDGDQGTALQLINEIRERNFDPYTPLNQISLDDILDEWAREFTYENKLRTQLVRHGKFTTNRYKFKDYDSEPWRIVFPIPQPELDGNPNLKQNEGY